MKTYTIYGLCSDMRRWYTPIHEARDDCKQQLIDFKKEVEHLKEQRKRFKSKHKEKTEEENEEEEEEKNAEKGDEKNTGDVNTKEASGKNASEKVSITCLSWRFLMVSNNHLHIRNLISGFRMTQFLIY